MTRSVYAATNPMTGETVIGYNRCNVERVAGINRSAEIRSGDLDDVARYYNDRLGTRVTILEDGDCVRNERHNDTIDCGKPRRKLFGIF